MKRSKIVVIGGGTGSYVALTGLKKYLVDLTAIVTMMDSGGSSGKLRDELGVLPPGDIRQCLVALSQSSRLLRKLFNYRFEEGHLRGDSFGNLFLSTLEKTTGSMKKAIEEVGKILRIQGKVVPVTFQKTDLCVELTDDKVIIGETHIDVLEKREKRAKIRRAYLKPKARANPDAIEEILGADFLLIGPGDLYTSIIPNLLVDEIKNALRKSKAKKIFVLNLMTKYGQTTSYTAKSHINDLEKYIGGDILDVVIINKKIPNKESLTWYAGFKEYPVKDDLKGIKYSVIQADLVRDTLLEKSSGDILRRSIIRHDPKKLAAVIMSFINKRELRV